MRWQASWTPCSRNGGRNVVIRLSRQMSAIDSLLLKAAIPLPAPNKTVLLFPSFLDAFPVQRLSITKATATD